MPSCLFLKFTLLVVAFGSFFPDALAAAPAAATSNKAESAINDAKSLAGSCEAKRISKRQEFLRMLQDPTIQDEDITNPERAQYVAFRKCAWVRQSPIEEKGGKPCQNGYVKVLNHAYRSDQLTADSCSILQKMNESLAQSASNSKETMAIAADGMAKVRAKLKQASDEDEQAQAELKNWALRTKTMAHIYRVHLQTIAQKIRVLQKTNPNLSPDDPEVEKALTTRDVEGVHLRQFMGLSHITALDPEQFDKKAADYEKYDINYKLAKTEDRNKENDSFMNQVFSSVASDDTGQFAAQNQQHLSTVRQNIEAKEAVFTRLRDTYGEIPATGSQSGTAASGTSSPATMKASLANKLAATPETSGKEESVNGTSASRAIPFLNSGGSSGSSAGNPSARLMEEENGNSYAKQPVPAVSASRSAIPVSNSALDNTNFDKGASVGSPPQTAQATNTSPKLEVPTAPLNSRALNVGTERGPSPGQGTTDALPLIATTLPATRSIDQSFLVGSKNASESKPGMPDRVAPPLPPKVAAQAAAFVETEIARLEKLNPMTPLLREQLRKRLSNAFASRYEKVTAEAQLAKTEGSAASVGEILRSANSEQDSRKRQAEEAFRMLSSDTDREVRRLVASVSDTSFDRDPSPGDATLFERVHAAYLRALK